MEGNSHDAVWARDVVNSGESREEFPDAVPQPNLL